MEIDDLLSGLAGFGNTVYNLFTNKRDFDYQKALQQQIFNREDTAVQRRMADLQAAGLNSNLAAGSAAGAGSVVSRSNTNDVNMGSALDMLQAVNNIRQQRQQTENAKVEHDILEFNKDIKENEKNISLANTLSQLGVPFNTTLGFDGKGNFGFYVGVPHKGKGKVSFSGSDSFLQQNLDYQMRNLKNSADLLQRDVDWYVADKVSGMALPFLKLFK